MRLEWQECVRPGKGHSGWELLADADGRLEFDSREAAMENMDRAQRAAADDEHALRPRKRLVRLVRLETHVEWIAPDA